MADLNDLSQKEKRGRPKSIPTPEKMIEYFNLYKEEVKNNPFERLVKGNKGFIVSDEKLQRPLTLEGFENWCHLNKIITDISDYFENKDGRYADYLPVCALIKRIIRQSQIEGGMAGIFNASITQRLNGLVDKKDVTSQGESIKPTILVQSKETANEINKLTGNV